MLDLSTIISNQYQLKWIDGNVITIPAPSHREYIQMSVVLKEANAEDERALTHLYQIVYALLKKGREDIDKEEVESLPMTVVMKIMMDYFTYYTDDLNSIEMPSNAK